MRYRTVTRLLTILILVIGVIAGWLMQEPSGEDTETVAETARQVPIYSVETQEKTLAISFDAAWGCERTETILDTLQKYDVKATFFLTNIWLDDYPEMAKKIADAGHEIAMHSVSHPHMPQLGTAEMTQELDGNYQKIVEVTGYTPTLFRFPFGDYDNTSMTVVRQSGYDAIQWSIDSLDWQESKTASDIVDRVTLALHPGAIILCHNNGTYTAEAIDSIIPYAQAQGYRFVPVGELIYKGAYEVNQQGVQLMPIAGGKIDSGVAEKQFFILLQVA